MFALPDTSSTELGHDIRISIRAEIEAMHVFKAHAKAHGQSKSLTALEAQERELWNALANAQFL